MIFNKTRRGFDISKFKDAYGMECSIQKSSLADKDCIWLGIHDAKPRILASEVMEDGVGWVDYPIPSEVMVPTRMHLTQDMAAELLPILQRFVDTGEVN